MVENEDLRVVRLGILFVEGEEVHHRYDVGGIGFTYGLAQIREPLVAEKHDVVPVGRQVFGKQLAKRMKNPKRERAAGEVGSILRRFSKTLRRNQVDNVDLVPKGAKFAVQLVILLADARFVVVIGDDGYFHARLDTAYS